MDPEVSTADYPLKAVCKNWLSKVRSAQKFKRAKFGDDAREAMQFFHADHNFMFSDLYTKHKKRGFLASAVDDESEDILPPSFQMCVNKVSELVQLFGPSLYHHDPVVNVTPKNPPQIDPAALGIDMQAVQAAMQQAQQMQQQMAQMGPQGMGGMPPQMPQIDPRFLQYQQMAKQDQAKQANNQAVSALLEYMLDYTQRASDKKLHARNMIDEALIKGMGVGWHEREVRDGCKAALISTFYDTVDNLVIDPDAKEWANVKWIARRCTHPVWQVEQEYNLPKGSLKKKANEESSESEANRDSEMDRSKAKVGRTNDLLTYWKIYSKLGMGSRMRGAAKEYDDDTSEDAKLAEQFDELGDFCFLVVAPGVEYFLNLPQKIWDLEDEDKPPEAGQPPTDKPEQRMNSEKFNAAQWPIPYWVAGMWPFEALMFHRVPNQTWPASHIRAGIGYLRFINWAFSFLASKIRVSCKTTLAVVKSAGEDLKTKLLTGKDYTVVEIEQLTGGHGKASDMIEFIQAPEFQGDIWKVLAAVMQEFERATGLTELLYGESTRQMRSAEEANIKQNAASIRPDDMAGQTEDFLSRCCAKEAMAMRWLYEPQDVEPIIGKVGAMFWQQTIMTRDLESVASEFDYRIEAGSARKPNKANEISRVNEALQLFMPAVSAFFQATGNPEQINALKNMWSKANDWPIPDFAQPPPPQPDPQVQQQMQLAQQEAQQSAQEHQQKLVEGQAKMQMEGQKQQLSAQVEMAKAKIGLETQQQAAQIKLAEAQQEAQMKTQTFAQEQMMGQIDAHAKLAQMLQQAKFTEMIHKTEVRQAEEMHRAKKAQVGKDKA